MSRMATPIPKYRKHRASGQAIVTLSGRDFYLGPYGTKVSKREYDRLTLEWLANGRALPVDEEDDAGITVVELLAAYRRWAVGYYRRSDGKPSSELHIIDSAAKRLRALYGDTPAAEFGPRELKALQLGMVREGLARPSINKLAGRIRRFFRWATSEDLIPADVYQKLATVDGLKAGRTDAPEAPPIEPADDEDVEATLPHLPPIVADMVRLSRLTGMRPAEVCGMKAGEIDRSGSVWSYTPAHHKTKHHNRRRVVCIGPQAQAVLAPYLLRGPDEPCFSPAESENRRRDDVHEKRRTPAAAGNVRGSNIKQNPRRKPGDAYQVESYRRAITRGIENLNKQRAADGLEPVKHWSPNQLRHALATELRTKFGLDVAAAQLGHASVSTSEVYARIDTQKAVAAMLEVG